MLDRRLNAYRPDLADTRLAGMVEAARFVEGVPGTVTAASAPLRSAPSHDAARVTEALLGELVRVFDTTAEGWSWVQLERDRYVGWVAPESVGEIGGPTTHVVSVARTFLFSAPDIKSAPSAQLSLGAAVRVLGETRDENAKYALVEPRGAVVFQHLDQTGSSRADHVDVAQLFMGTPYLWGGKTGLGIDCSGLVQVACQAAGISAPRDSDMQADMLGVPLASTATQGLRRGDFVFWPGHVGIMQDSETLLHANAWHMMVAAEPLRDAVARFAAKGIEISVIRRIHPE